MSATRIRCELVEYADGLAVFEEDAATFSAATVELPLAEWDQLGRPDAVIVTVDTP
jgi:hypothetical protein